MHTHRAGKCRNRDKKKKTRSNGNTIRMLHAKSWWGYQSSFTFFFKTIKSVSVVLDFSCVGAVCMHFTLNLVQAPVNIGVTFDLCCVSPHENECLQLKIVLRTVEDQKKKINKVNVGRKRFHWSNQNQLYWYWHFRAKLLAVSLAASGATEEDRPVVKKEKKTECIFLGKTIKLETDTRLVQFLVKERTLRYRHLYGRIKQIHIGQLNPTWEKVRLTSNEWWKSELSNWDAESILMVGTGLKWNSG